MGPSDHAAGKKRSHNDNNVKHGNVDVPHKKQKLESSNGSQKQISNGNLGSIPDTKILQPDLSKALSFDPVSLRAYEKPIRPYTGHPSTLPPLPPVLIPSLATIAFTHVGAHPGSTSHKIQSTYDRLEFLGDAYIQIIATRLVYTLLPNHSVGRLSQQREYCVKNETLAKYAAAYGFPERADLPSNITKANKPLWIKTMGDIFEAYVAAIILGDPERGFQTVETWLTTLWQYELSRETKSSKVETQVVMEDAKVELAKAVGGRGVKLAYSDEREAEMIRKQGKLIYHIGVFIEGWGYEDRFLGRGEGLSKQDAGAMAAAEALKNPLLSDIRTIKKRYDAMAKGFKERGEIPPPFSVGMSFN